MANEQISLPTLLVILVLSGLIIRYLFFSPATTPAQQQQHQQRDATGSAQRAREAAVERIQQMFPQLDRRTILWDLQRTGGSIPATTERILSGRIDTPPITFQPPPPPVSPSPSSSHLQQKAPSRPAEPDLITRYHLENKIHQSTTDAETEAKSKGWSSNKEERQSLLQRRRDEMILAARRKMEAKLAAEKAARAGPSSAY